VIRTPDQRVRVFVSSTLGELAPERRAVTSAITQMRLTPVLFELGARPYAPRDLYRAYLKQSDVFVGVYAESYGWIAPGMEVSGQEDEYRLAADMPRLIYMKETARRDPRLTSFLKAIEAEGVVSYRRFKDADELASLVADDLALLLTERFVGPPAAPPVAPLPAPRWPLVDRVEEMRSVTGLLERGEVVERLLLAAAPLAEQILERAPGLKVLATSREPLRIRGERVVAVAPLALPDAAALVDLGILAAVPAVAFFLTCAREARSDFSLTETNAAAVAEICRRLDGLPLALQLAAARLTVLPPEALLARLERRLPLLTRGPRDLPERQQTLRAAIGWSYDMLGAAEQRLFRQLGVFVGGFTLEAVEALIAGGPDDLDPLEAISTLVGQSVVGVQPPDEGTPRYRMLETIREFALERLEAAGEAPQARRRHAEFFRDLAERDEPMLLGTTRQRTSMAQLERAHDNMRAALAWSVSPDGELAVGIALAGALGWFWLMSGRLQEAQSWYTQLLARRGDADDSLTWAKVLHGSALQLWGLGDLSQAEAIEESAIAIFRSAGERRWLSYGLALLARVRTGQEQLEEAQALLEEARDVWRQVEVTYGQPFDAYLRYYLGSAALVQGDLDAAGAHLEASLRDLGTADDDLARGVLLGAGQVRRGPAAPARRRRPVGSGPATAELWPGRGPGGIAGCR
jgi:predicted ATPase